MSFRESVVEVIDTVVDELRMGVKRPIFVLEKLVFYLFIQRRFDSTYRLACQNGDVVVAHVISRRAELYSLIVVDVFVLGIAAEKNNHLHLFDLLADKRGQLLQILSFARR